ncbi:hypothetical protein [Sulfitobacter sp.]|uniref:hypothetical protein n=1 Tax=Sulfitobacter sp. TaxID=1903071 RepID=UPI004059F20E
MSTSPNGKSPIPRIAKTSVAEATFATRAQERRLAQNVSTAMTRSQVSSFRAMPNSFEKTKKTVSIAPNRINPALKAGLAYRQVHAALDP